MMTGSRKLLTMTYGSSEPPSALHQSHDITSSSINPEFMLKDLSALKKLTIWISSHSNMPAIRQTISHLPIIDTLCSLEALQRVFFFEDISSFIPV